MPGYVGQINQSKEGHFEKGGVAISQLTGLGGWQFPTAHKAGVTQKTCVIEGWQSSDWLNF